MTHTCKDCKYWGNARNYAVDVGRLKSCNAPSLAYGYNVDIDNVPDNGALIEDDEGWGMLTGPMFGCVLWERGNDN